MQILYSRCCGIDVHKDSVTACVLVYSGSGWAWSDVGGDIGRPRIYREASSGARVGVGCHQVVE